MTSTTKSPRPANDRGQGRKPLPPSEKAEVYSIRLKPAHQVIYEDAGGTEDLLRPLLELGAPKLRKLVADVAPPAPPPPAPTPERIELEKAAVKLKHARDRLEQARMAVKSARARAKERQ